MIIKSEKDRRRLERMRRLGKYKIFRKYYRIGEYKSKWRPIK